MTDEQLAQYLGIAKDPGWPKVIASLSSAHRRTYEYMAQLDRVIDLWEQGLGPKPPEDVLLDYPKPRGRSGSPRA